MNISEKLFRSAKLEKAKFISLNTTLLSCSGFDGVGELIISILGKSDEI